MKIGSRVGRFAFTAARWAESLLQSRLIKRVEREVRRRELALGDGRERQSPVLFFNASTRILGMSLNGAFSLLSSWGLRLAGEPVVYVACMAGMPQCMLGTLVDQPFRDPPCRSCTYFTRQVLPQQQRIDFSFRAHRYESQNARLTSMGLQDLLGVEHAGLPLGELCLPSIRWALRRHNLEDDPATRHLLRRYILGAMNVHDTFREIIDEVKPRAVVLFNGQSYPEAIVKSLAVEYGIPAITHEVGARPFSAFFTHGEATAYPIAIPEHFVLGDEENRALEAYLGSRFRGDFTMAGIRFWPEIQGLPEQLQRRIASFSQMVVVFTNVIFDTSQPHANVLFEDMFAWLRHILDYAEGAQDTLFIIRAHPDEYRPGKEARESVEAKMREWRGGTLPNVEFIRPDVLVSSYELIRMAKFVMVYNSTIGLEASILGAPVLCGGRSRYTPYPTVFFPESRADYDRLLEGFLRADRIEVPPGHAQEARRFLYYQLFHTSLDFSRFLRQAPRFPGQVRLRRFRAADLDPEVCQETAIIRDGILDRKPFVYRGRSGRET